MRILLVEDEQTLRIGLADDLRAEGYSVDAVEDGEKALMRAAAETFDCIVLDLLLPGRNGLCVCRELRASEVTTPMSSCCRWRRRRRGPWGRRCSLRNSMPGTTTLPHGRPTGANCCSCPAPGIRAKNRRWSVSDFI